MIIKTLPKNDILKADKLQVLVLKPKKRYRSYNFIKNSYNKNPNLFLGAYEQNKLVGIIFGHIQKDSILIGEFAVLKKFQSLGIGSKLLNEFEKRAKKTKKPKITLGAYGRAEKFYLKHKYSPKIFLQIKLKDVPTKYKKFKYKILNDVNLGEDKKLTIDIKKYDASLKERLRKKFNAYNSIYLFEKKL